MARLKTVDEAYTAILSSIKSIKIHSLDLDKTNGLFLAEDILADRDFPPFHRVAMDGIAINMSAYLRGLRKFSIEGIRKAGEVSAPLIYVDNSLEVMTGCVLPMGTNIIIPYEQVDIEGGKAELKDGVTVKPMMNIHQQGSDIKSGSIVLKKGSRINAPEMAILASVGKCRPLVFSVPKIAFIGTGDELVDISVDEKSIQAHQIRKSNGPAVKSLIESFGPFKVDLFHLKDKQDELYTEIGKILQSYDMLILSGGVSAGKFDYVPSVLKDLKVEEHFHKVSQRPGKPLWYGVGETGQIVFGLPGNPVSALMSCRRFIVTLLGQLISGGKTHGVFEGTEMLLNEEFSSENNFTLFRPCTIKENKIHLFQTNGSGDFASLAGSDGIVELPGHKSLKCGEDKVKFFGWRS